MWFLVGVVMLALVVLGLRAVTGGSPRVAPSPMLAAAVPVDEAGLRAFARTPAAIVAGQAIFAGLCWNCHGRLGEGTATGPNLRDDWWLGGNDMTDLVAVIRNGRPGTAMQAMASYYTPDQIAAVAAYVVSLKGTSGGNGKTPEGTLKPIAW